MDKRYSRNNEGGDRAHVGSGAVPMPLHRPWTASLVRAAILVGLALLLSAAINPLLGRRVHWDWTAPLGVALFLLLAVALRRRWV